MPAGLEGVARTKVREQDRGASRAESYPTTSEHYRGADKVLTLAARGLQIREVPDEDEEDPGNGDFPGGSPTWRSLVLLLRVGNEVEIRFPRAR